MAQVTPLSHNVALGRTFERVKVSYDYTRLPWKVLTHSPPPEGNWMLQKLIIKHEATNYRVKIINVCNHNGTTRPGVFRCIEADGMMNAQCIHGALMTNDNHENNESTIQMCVDCSEGIVKIKKYGLQL